MEIRQGTTVTRWDSSIPLRASAASAGHCRGTGAVTDRDGRFVGTVATARDNTPDGTVVRTDEVISDYGRSPRLLTSPSALHSPGSPTDRRSRRAALAPGQPICHSGWSAGGCGTVERVNNGWFTDQRW